MAPAATTTRTYTPTTDGETTFPATPTPRALAKPTRIDVVSALVAKHDASENLAEYFVTVLEKARDHQAEHGTPLRLSMTERKRIHDLLATTMPAYTKAKPGSTHELLDRALLNGTSFRHGLSADQCAIEICDN